MRIVIPGRPIAWKRARRRGPKYFDPQHEEKQRVRMEVFAQLGKLEPFLKPVRLTIEFHQYVPTSLSKIKQSRRLKTPHMTVPDLDNLIKFLSDALNGVIWADDALIYEIHARKVYHEDPKTILVVEPWNEVELNPLPDLLPAGRLCCGGR